MLAAGECYDLENFINELQIGSFDGWRPRGVRFIRSRQRCSDERVRCGDRRLQGVWFGHYAGKDEHSSKQADGKGFAWIPVNSIQYRHIGRTDPEPSNDGLPDAIEDAIFFAPPGVAMENLGADVAALLSATAAPCAPFAPRSMVGW